MNIKKLLLIITILSMTFIISSCAQNSEENIKTNKKEIIVSSAASLTDVFTQIEPKFEQETGIKLTLNFASSGTLEKQIEQGALVDMFISASQNHMDILENKNLIDKDSRNNLIKNRITLIVSDNCKDMIKSLSDITKKEIKISIGEPVSVPAGQYAKESLIYFGIYDQLRDKIVYAKNVKQVVRYVEMGEVDAGIVYNSDTTVLKNSAVIQVLEEKSHKPIIYPAAIISSSKHKELVNVFLEYLRTNEAQDMFEKYGFELYTK